MATEKWEKFFMDAGIPSGPAKIYAMKFSDNRMRISMLNDLSKEILRDLGINLIGDMIAILKHGRDVYDQWQREQAEDFDVEDKTSKSDKGKAKQLRKKDFLIDKAAVLAACRTAGLKGNSKEQRASQPGGRKTLSDRFNEQDTEVHPPKKAREVKELPHHSSELDTSKKANNGSAVKSSKGPPSLSMFPLEVRGETKLEEKDSSVFDRLQSPNEKTAKDNKPSNASDLGSLKPLKAVMIAKKRDMSKSSSIFSRLGAKSELPLEPSSTNIAVKDPTVAVTGSSTIPKISTHREEHRKVPNTSTGVFGRLGSKTQQGSPSFESTKRVNVTMEKPIEKVRPIVRGAIMDKNPGDGSSVFARLGKR